MADEIEFIDEHRDGYIVSDMASRLYPHMESYPGQMMFMPWSISPKHEIELVREKAARAASHAERTSTQLTTGREKHADMVVGNGLMVRPTPDWDLLPMFTKAQRIEYSNACRAHFNDWGYSKSLTQDAEGHYNFGGLMWLAYHNKTGPEGETVGAVLQDEDRMIRKGARWSTYVNVIHPSRVQTPPLLSGNEIDMGIFKGRQLDSDGAWEGLYILRRHPSDAGMSYDDYDFIPRFAANGRIQAWHDFHKTMGGAQRGLTPLITAISRVLQVDKAYDGVVGSIVLNSLFATWVKSGGDPATVAERLAPDPRTGLSSFDKRAAFYKAARIRFGNMRVPVLPDGDEMKMESSNRAAQDPTMAFNLFLREFAASTGTTFGQLANNWSDANYSAARAEFEDVWRSILRKRGRFELIPSICYSSVIEEAIMLRNRIKLPPGAPPFEEFRDAYTRCAWMGPGKIQIDPEKEANANEVGLRTMQTNLDEIWAARGQFYYDGLVQYALEQEEVGDLNIVVPTMPGQAGATTTTDNTGDQSGNQRRKPAPAAPAGD